MNNSYIIIDTDQVCFTNRFLFLPFFLEKSRLSESKNCKHDYNWVSGKGLICELCKFKLKQNDPSWDIEYNKILTLARS